MQLIQDIGRHVAIAHARRIAFSSESLQTTFLEFFKKSDYIAGSLQSLGIKKNDRIAILSVNCMEYIAYHYATASIGAILLPLNIRHTDAEMLWIINDAKASALIIDENLNEHLNVLKTGCMSLEFSIGIGTVENADYSTSELLDAKRIILNSPSLSPKDPVLLIYTSGTTGRPKGALQTHEGCNIIDELTADAMQASEKDVYLAFMPYFHQAGLIRTRATLIVGGTNIVVGKMDIERIVTQIAQRNISITMLVPPLDNLLSKFAEERETIYPNLRLIIGAGGAGPLHAERMKVFCKKFDCEFMGVYGQTETTGPVTIVMGDDYFENPYTCGKPLKGIDLQIWDDNNKPLPPGVTGEIVVRSKTTVLGYWKNELANKKLYSGDWLHTGDLGYIDIEGFLYFVDRKKELIKTGGENVYPREVENVLAKHSSISDLAIVGLPDPNEWGEIVTAVVVPKSGEQVTLDDLRNFCKGKIANYKIPKKLFLEKEIPRNSTGKVMKINLRNRLKNRIKGVHK